jgi:hypothetical protein
VSPSPTDLGDGEDPDPAAEEQKLIPRQKPPPEAKVVVQLGRALKRVEAALLDPTFIAARRPELLGADIALVAVLLLKGLGDGYLEVEAYRTPPAYRPIFMVDDDGSIIARDWAVGFALGIGLRSKEWGECILLTEHRQALVPILVYCEGELDLLPDMPAAEKCRWRPTAHAEIAHAVAAARAICNPYRAAEARRQPVNDPAPTARASSPGRRVASGQVKPPNGADSAPLTSNLNGRSVQSAVSRRKSAA